MINESVREVFVDFSSALEGVVPWMYVDVKQLVTVAIGNLIDTPDSAVALPFVRKRTGERATRTEILAEWSMVKTHPTAARQGHRALEAVTELRLTPEGIRSLVMRKLESNHAVLVGWYPELESWPADAILAVYSMAWACGPAFGGTHAGGFPRLAAALRARDFGECERQCHMNEAGNAGLIPRNKANKALFRAAVAPADPELVSWDVLTAADAAHFPARPREPSIVTPDQLEDEPAIVRPRVDLPQRDEA